LGKKYYEVEDAFKELQKKYASLERDFEKTKSEKEEDNIIKQQLQDEIHKIKIRVASMEEAAQNEFKEKNDLRTKLIQEKARTTELLKEKDSFLQKETQYMLAESHTKSEICKLKVNSKVLGSIFFLLALILYCQIS
jgi:chromosome segregation ATPase